MGPLQPDYDAAVAQLEAERSEGPWNLSTGGEGATFTDPEKAKRWMEKRNSNGENIYRSPNVAPNPTGANGRALKSDIPAADRIFVDCDVYKDDLAPDESWRALSVPERKARLTQELNEGKYGPAPTWTVDSGGGLQPIWRLEDPVAVSEIERMNLWLAERIPFGDPGTWNGDRLLRVPGTINWPDAKKKAIGRVPVVAHVVAANDTMYWDKDFGRAKPKSAEKVEVDIVLNPIFPETLDPLGLSERTKTIVRDGRLPEKKANDDSGSAWLFDCMLSLLREGVDPNMVLGIITDARWGISKTIGKHAHTPEEAEHYAARQVRRALGTLEAERKKLFPDDVDDVVAADVDAVEVDGNIAGLSYSLASDVEAKPLNPLWPGRIFIGKLTTLAGMPDQGKSVVSCDIAARVSRGDEWPDGRGSAPAGHVIILSAEDDPEDTIKPRLMAADAVLDRVIILHSLVVSKGGKRMFNIASDIPRLDALVKRFPETRALIVDPANAYMGTSKENDSFRDSDVRAVLSPLKEWAEEHKVAVIIITHFKKGGTGRAIDQVMGSLAFTALSRSAWAFIEEKDLEDRPTGRKLMAKIKQNITEPVDAVAYSLVGVEVAPGISAPRVQWGGVVKGNADDLMHAAKPRPAEKLMLAVSFLRSELAEGPVPASTIQREARAAGFAEKTVNRAKEEIGAVSERTAEGWVWRLSTAADDFPDDQDGLDGT